MRALTTASAAAIFLAGCSVLPSAPPAVIFDVRPPHAAPATADALPLTISVAQPSAMATYDTDRMAIRTTANELRYVADARWSDSAPRLVQSVLIAALERSGRYAAVIGETTAPRDFVLGGELRHFEAELRGEDVLASIELVLRVQGGADRRILAVRTFAAETEAASDDPGDIARAFEAAFARILPEVEAWTHQTVSAAPPPAGGEF